MILSAHHRQEQDYWDEQVEVETSEGQKKQIKTFLLRVYPTPLNGYDAYMDISKSEDSDITTVYSEKLNIKWKVIGNPQEAPISGCFRGNYTENNPPAWVFGLKKTIAFKNQMEKKITFNLDLSELPEKILNVTESELKQGVEIENGNGIQLKYINRIEKYAVEAHWTFFFEIIVPAAVTGATSGTVGTIVKLIFDKFKNKASNETIKINEEIIKFEEGQITEIVRKTIEKS